MRIIAQLYHIRVFEFLANMVEPRLVVEDYLNVELESSAFLLLGVHAVYMYEAIALKAAAQVNRMRTYVA